MESRDSQPEIEWFETPLPRGHLWMDSAITVIVIVIFAVILIVTGFSQGDIVLPSAFALFFGVVLALVWFGHLRRAPSRMGFSEGGVHFRLRGRDHRIDWRMVEDVEVSRFLGEDYADVYYPGRKRETRVHIHGEAARQLRSRFEERRKGEE